MVYTLYVLRAHSLSDIWRSCPDCPFFCKSRTFEMQFIQYNTLPHPTHTRIDQLKIHITFGVSAFRFVLSYHRDRVEMPMYVRGNIDFSFSVQAIFSSTVPISVSFGPLSFSRFASFNYRARRIYKINMVATIYLCFRPNFVFSIVR